MIRVIVLNVILLFLPALLYLAFRQLSGIRAPLRPGVFAAFLMAGFVLMVVSLGILTEFSGEKNRGTFIPPRLKNGVIERGHVE